VRGAVSSSHRWPTLNELVRNFQVGAVLTRANPNLLPERSRSSEIAVAVSGRNWQASAGGFWTVVNDAISNVTIQTTPSIIRERRNAGEAHAKGLELDLDIKPIERVSLRASALVVDSRFRDSLEPVLEGNRLPQVPRAAISLSGDAKLHDLVSASFAWRAISSQYDDDRNSFLLSDARQLDLRLVAGTSRLSFEINVENATDARVEVGRTPLVTVAPGRAIRVALRLMK
jgi:iron complex outermembrane receptor protein